VARRWLARCSYIVTPSIGSSRRDRRGPLSWDLELHRSQQRDNRAATNAIIGSLASVVVQRASTNEGRCLAKRKKRKEKGKKRKKPKKEKKGKEKPKQKGGERQTGRERAPQLIPRKDSSASSGSQGELAGTGWRAGGEGGREESNHES